MSERTSEGLSPTSSGEGRAGRQSFVTDLEPSTTTAPIVNSNDDFKLRTVDQVFPNGTMVIKGSSPPISPPPRPPDQGDTRFSKSWSPDRTSPNVVVVNGCPCDLDSHCRQQCCVETLRAMHRARVEKTSANSKLLQDGNSSNSSYGSIESLTKGSAVSGMTSPVGINCDSDEEVGIAVRKKRSASPDAVHCVCHKPMVDHTTRRAVLRLVAASLIALFFMVGEVLGGYFANSLAIMTDAAHMLSDFAGFLISLFAIWVSRRPPSRGMSFGWHRAEVIGALVSVLIIWVLTGVLFYEAVKRVIHQDFEVDADIMLITACVGVFVNVFMCMVLGHGHGHSHGGGGGHGHSHGGGGRRQDRGSRRKGGSTENINVRAAFIHVIGDLIQSIGVVIAGYIIWIWPSLKIVDPICTFIFSFLVLISTFNILKDALRVVMEGTPKNIDYEEVKANLKNLVKGVKQAHSLHIWSLTLDKTALSAHLVLEPGANGDAVISRANQMLKEEHNITKTTLQVESYQEVMDECGPCQEPERVGVLMGLLPQFLRPKRRPSTRTTSSERLCAEPDNC